MFKGELEKTELAALSTKSKSVVQSPSTMGSGLVENGQNVNGTAEPKKLSPF